MNFVSNAILSLVGSLAVLVLIKVFSGNFISHFQLSMKLIDVYAQGNFFMSWLLFFILLMLSGSLGLLAGVFNDRIDGVKKLIVLLLLLMIPILLGTIAQLGGTNAPENAPCLASNGWLSIHWFYCPATSSDNQLLCGH